MSWIPPSIDWLYLRTGVEHSGAIRSLLMSNPVINGSLSRPSGRRNPYADMNSLAQRVLRGKYAYPTSQDLEFDLTQRITWELIIDHHTYSLGDRDPEPVDCKIQASQIFWPASFYVVSKGRVFDWENGAPQRDFYETADKGNRGKRHPAVVIERTNAGLYVMVPCSHKRGGGVVRVNFDRWSAEPSYAICKKRFLTTWKMLWGDPIAHDRVRRVLSLAEHDKVRGKLRELQIAS